MKRKKLLSSFTNRLLYMLFGACVAGLIDSETLKKIAKMVVAIYEDMKDQ